MTSPDSLILRVFKYIPWESLHRQSCHLHIRTVVIHLQCRRPLFDSWVGKICWKRDRLPTPVFSNFSCGSGGKETAYNAGDLGSIPGLERSPGEDKGYPLQYSRLENSTDCIVHGFTKSWTQLRDFHFHCSNLYTFYIMFLLYYTGKNFQHCVK